MTDIKDKMVPWLFTAPEYNTAILDKAWAQPECGRMMLNENPVPPSPQVVEAITNIASTPIGAIGNIKLSANWMAPAGHPGEDVRLFEAVRAVGEELAPALGIAIPVGKDSMSMSTVWHEGGQEKRVTAPLSLIVSAFAPATDIRRALTPQLRTKIGDTELLLIDLGAGKNRLGGSALAQVFGQIGKVPPDLDDPTRLLGFFATIQELMRDEKILAYHDRSDGGLFVTLLEMAFAGGTGLDIALAPTPGDTLAQLFSEELGAVVQVRKADVGEVRACFARHGLEKAIHTCGQPTAKNEITIRSNGQALFTEKRTVLRGIWSETTFAMQTLRDDPTCAAEENDSRCDADDAGLCMRPTFDAQADVAAPFIARGARPRVAILREQGVNGQIEMAGRKFGALAVLFEPLPPAGLLDFLEQFASNGGKLIWSGPPPRLDLSGQPMLAKWQKLFGAKTLQFGVEGQIAVFPNRGF